MYVIRRTGHGQTICAGCLAKGENAINWDNMLVELHYDGGTTIGNFCSECMSKIKALYKVEVRTNDSK